jgi:uncharacterized delta-60 repeat protein
MRGTPNADAYLAGLAVSNGMLSPQFSSGRLAYLASYGYGTSSITVTPTLDDAQASVTVNGAAVTSGTPSTPIALAVGWNTIQVVVTAKNGTAAQTYTINVSRASGSRDVDVLSEGTVSAIAKQADGKIIVAGSFTHVSGVARTNLARLNADGSLDSTWNPGVDGTVAAILIDAGGSVFIGGCFGRAGGQPRAGLARILPNGSLDTLWNPQPGIGAPFVPCVNALAHNGTDSLYVGGYFSSMNGQSRVGLAKVASSGTGVVDPSWNALLNNTSVTSIVRDGSGNLFIAGQFNAIAGTYIVGVAKLAESNALLDATWNPQVSSGVNALAPDGNGGLILGGYFYTVGGVNRPALAKVSMSGTGSLDTSWAPGPSDAVAALALDGAGNVYAGSYASLIKISSTGTVDGSWTPVPPPPPYSWPQISALLWDGDKVLVGGRFSRIGGQRAAGFARLSTTTALADPPASYFQSPSNIWVQALARDGQGRVTIGGSFSFVGGTPRGNVARFNADGSLDLSWAADTDGTVTALTTSAQSDVYVGGSFTHVSAQPRNHLAKISAAGVLDAGWMPEPDGSVSALLPDPTGKLYVGGQFMSIAGQARSNLARVSAAGAATADSWNPGANSTVNSLAFDSEGYLAVAGWFNSIGGQPRWAIAKLSTVSGTATTWYPAPSAYVAAVTPGSAGAIYMVGSFATLGAQYKPYLARIFGDALGQPDSAWNPGTGGAVYAVAADTQDTVYAAGDFGKRILRFPSNLGGSPDPAFNPAPDSSIQAILLDGTGRVFVGGSFTAIAGQQRSGYAELYAPASPDAPVAVTAIAGDGQASVSFQPPPSLNGTAVTGYIVTSDPPGGTDGGANTTSLQHTVTGLANGTAYTFTVQAVNALGLSLPSTPSNGVTPLSGNAALSSLSLSGGTLSPGFASDTLSYSVAVPGSVASITVTPALANGAATMTLNGTPLASGSTSAPISLNVGKNLLVIMVTAQDGVTTRGYWISITRASGSLSANADLSGLSLTAGALVPGFASGTLSYAASVAYAVTSIRATPTAADSTATVKVNGNTVPSGGPSSSISLNEGQNSITIIVTAQDGSVKVYTVMVTRASAPVRILESGIGFGSLQAAYNAAANGSTILLQAGTLAENVVLWNSLAITLKGGYDAAYSSNSGVTELSGSLTITNGLVYVENLVVR